MSCSLDLIDEIVSNISKLSGKPGQESVHFVWGEIMSKMHLCEQNKQNYAYTILTGNMMKR